ncbi:hypothetical protein ZIOFF_035507 [Zingiber officinale]|uniref:Uncharacterized protein n=1 Tax=Zingiber officinale TaxID=94328 RepID=A0A8J5G9S7_ZINOF|nr:hypothetical protein ZIOFF_035507 [Zingiber officinale]
MLARVWRMASDAPLPKLSKVPIQLGTSVQVSPFTRRRLDFWVSESRGSRGGAHSLSINSPPFPVFLLFISCFLLVVANSSANPRAGRRIVLAEQEEIKGVQVTPEKAAGEAEPDAVELTAPAGWTKKGLLASWLLAYL